MNVVLGSTARQKGLDPDHLSVEEVLRAAKAESTQNSGSYSLPLMDTLVRLSVIRGELARRSGIPSDESHSPEL